MAPAFGYVALPTHAHPNDHAEAVALTRRELAACALRGGYTLAGVFADVRGRTESGLYGILDAVRRGEAVAVLVPDLAHLRHAGCHAGADPHTAARCLCARLLPRAPDRIHDGPEGPLPELRRRDLAASALASAHRRVPSATGTGARE